MSSDWPEDQMFIGTCEADILSHSADVRGGKTSGNFTGTACVILDVKIRPEGRPTQDEQVMVWLSDRTEGAVNMVKRNLLRIGFLPDNTDMELLDSNPVLLKGKTIMVDCLLDGDYGYKVELASKIKITKARWDHLNKVLLGVGQEEAEDDTPF